MLKDIFKKNQVKKILIEKIMIVMKKKEKINNLFLIKFLLNIDNN